MLTQSRKESNFKMTVSTIFFGNENTFKISFQNYSHISFQMDIHLLYKSHIQIKIIVKCHLKLIYIKSIWLLK